MSLKLFRRRSTGPWYIRGTLRGRSVYQSTGLDRRQDAEEVLALRSAELLHEAIHGLTVVRTFAHATIDYLQSAGDATHLGPLVEHFGDTLLSSIGQHEIDVAARKLKPAASPSTRNRQIYTPMVAVLNHAARLGWCAKPIISRPKTPKGRVRWLTFEEADRLTDAAASHLRPLVIFLLATGARLSEALYLDWREVDLARAHVTFQNVQGGGAGTKNGDSRGVPLHPRAAAALANLPHRTGRVFRKHLGLTSKAGHVRQLGPGYAHRGGKGGGQLKTAWNGMLRRAGIADFTPHDCRHCWATWHYRANNDLIALMELGGWKSLAMVQRYAHANVENRSASIDRIWGSERAKSVQSDAEAGKNLNNTGS